MPESIHLCDFPVYDASRRDEGLERRMKVTMKTVSMGRSLRTDYALKIRQPLNALHLVTRDPEEKRILSEMEDLMKDELNVKTGLSGKRGRARGVQGQGELPHAGQAARQRHESRGGPHRDARPRRRSTRFIAGKGVELSIGEGHSP